MSWLSTFTRFRPGRRALLGPVGLFVADWSQPQRSEEAPMFDVPLLERFSVVHPAAPTMVFLPAGLYCLWLSISTLGAALSIGLYAAGLLVWSLFEYIAHRRSFHHEPSSERQLTLVYLAHGVHHAYPDDARRWMIPLGASVPLAVVFYLLFSVVSGRYADGLFAGFIHGYLTYDLLHYFIHRGRMPGRVGRFLRQHHMAHHYARPEKNFGVSSPLWDVVFRTR
ncbi:MAG: sterol desaturase family protein [Vicinamibacterales bacterium]